MSAPFDADRFIARAVQDALEQATAQHWLRRAEDFEAALPAEGDFLGNATSVTVAEQVRRLRAKAMACRNRATLCELTADEERLILDFVRAALAWTAKAETGVAA